MPFQSDQITKKHVLQAIQDIDKNGLRYPLARSSVFFLLYNGKTYPPKYTIQLAHEFATGRFLEYTELNTTEAQKALKKISDDFIIQTAKDDPLQPLIARYKKYLSETELKEEAYKWQLLEEYKGRPNLNVEDFTEEIRAINFSNLIYGVGIGVTNHIARDAAEDYRNCFKSLFNETIPLQERLKSFSTDTLAIYRSLGVEKVSHHQDERTMATFLTYHNPDKYAFYKDSFYQKLCKLLEIKSRSVFEKYPHYLELLNDFISDYVNPDKELLDTVNKLLPDNAFPDNNHLLLTQDILYQTLDKQYGVERNYWRIGTKDAEMSYWDNMRSNGKIAIGWSDLGDLNNLDINSKKEIEAALKNKKYYPKDKNTLSRKAGEIFNFYNSTKIGDIILAQDGSKILGIGVIKDEYHFEPNEGFPHQKDVDWLIENPNFINKQGLQTTVYKIDDPTIISKVDKVVNNTMNTESKRSTTITYPLNQILFGPPGTGKTYHTMNKALEIIGVDTSLLDRKSIKEEFEKRSAEGQIVFTTFHQSMSYEDFIEGIKPNVESDENESIKYKIEDGILKRLCRKAITEYYKEDIGNKKISTTTDRLQLYDEAWDHLVNAVQKSLDDGKPLELLSLSGKSLDVIKITQQGNLILKPRGDNAEDYTVSYLRTQKLFEAYPNLSLVKNIDKEFRQVIGGSNSTAYWCVINNLNAWVKQNTSNSRVSVQVSHINEALVKFDNQIVKANRTANVKPFVLIIDEINRGNVSKIFGELITLIEQDKRLGCEEALEIILPYSKEKFGVPANLYIVGTMNTADRSVEALDTALRRRFSFEEMQPNSELLSPSYLYWKLLWKYKEQSWDDETYLSKEKLLLNFVGASEELRKDRHQIWDKMEKEGISINQISYFDKYIFTGINLQLILDTINSRLEVLKDRDHCIGHAYFIHVSNIADLITVFKDSILPLLQEYFFGDYYKIQLVLGKGFINSISSTAQFAIEDDGEFDDKLLYSINFKAFSTEEDFKSALSDMKINEK